MAINSNQHDELVDYEEEDDIQMTTTKPTPKVASKQQDASGSKEVKKGYVGIHSTSFRDFLLKPELLRAIVDCGFEHPSEGTENCIPEHLTLFFQ